MVPEMTSGLVLATIGGVGTALGAAIGGFFTWMSQRSKSKVDQQTMVFQQGQQLRDVMMQEIGRLQAKDDHQEKQIAALEEKWKAEKDAKHASLNELSAAKLALEAAKAALTRAEDVIVRLETENQRLLAENSVLKDTSNAS